MDSPRPSERYVNIFGEEVAVPDKAKRKSPVPRGHAARPGTGPDGETCGSCAHVFRRQLGKTYLKCSLAKAKWTGGGASDIRARDAACSRWERKADAV